MVFGNYFIVNEKIKFELGGFVFLQHDIQRQFSISKKKAHSLIFYIAKCHANIIDNLFNNQEKDIPKWREQIMELEDETFIQEQCNFKARRILYRIDNRNNREWFDIIDDDNNHYFYYFMGVDGNENLVQNPHVNAENNENDQPNNNASENAYLENIQQTNLEDKENINPNTIYETMI